MTTWGEHLGTVMVAEDFPSVWERLRGASSYLLTYLGIALALGVAGSWLLARRIKRQTLGLEPHEITGLAEHREALLYGIAEGVIALDPHDRITLVNDVARRLLDLPEHAAGMSLRDLRVEGRLLDVLTGLRTAATDGLRDQGHAEVDSRIERRVDNQVDAHEDVPRDDVVIRRGRVLVMNRMRVTRDGRHLGTVTTLRDRTTLANLERELGSFRSTTQLLRAQTHEFANQLHTISGLIQLGDYDEVVRYVDAVTERRQSLDLLVNSRVRDPAVAALLMAKASLASERRVDLRVSEETSLDRLTAEDSADVATVVGNLVDNAMDAVSSGPPGQWVGVEIRQDAASVEISVSDSGPGVPPEVAQEVFAHGFTTKAATSGERGIGLALTRLVCQRRGGEVAPGQHPGRWCELRRPAGDRSGCGGGPVIRVLVVDDDFMVARVHTGFVSRVDGFEVVGTRHSGAEAVEAVTELEPDLVLLDLYLPDRFGLDVIADLRAAGRECDVMVITAAKEAEAVRGALRQGVVDYVLKPFGFEDLRERLERYAAQRHALAAAQVRGQEDIDRALSRGGAAGPAAALPKGMSPQTAELVEEALRAADDNLSASETAERVGVSRVSARRYLEYFCSIGQAEVSLRYGSTGRPERRYRWCA